MSFCMEANDERVYQIKICDNVLTLDGQLIGQNMFMKAVIAVH